MTKARASSPGRPLSLTTTRIRLAADRQSECRSPALPSSPDVTQRTFENRRSVCLGERAPGWLRPRITGYSAGPLPLAGVRRHRLPPRLSRAGCCLSRASAAGTEALQMTCRLALRSASAGVSGMSRMTPLCGNSHWAGLAGRPGACGRLDCGVSRRGSAIAVHGLSKRFGDRVAFQDVSSRSVTRRCSASSARTARGRRPWCARRRGIDSAAC